MTGNREIDDLLNKVMDLDGNMKSCGRETCKRLLQVLKEEYPDKDFGNLESGFGILVWIGR